MEIMEKLSSKTALEYLISLNNKNIVTVCRDLSITPQQFSDWIKHRRPIPSGRIAELADYFSVPLNTLAGDDRFAKRLSALDRVELEILVASNLFRETSSTEKRGELKYNLEKLKTEREKQLRIARLSAMIEKDDPEIMRRVDSFMDELEEIGNSMDGKDRH